MLTWLLAVVLVGGFAALGMQLGGIRAAVAFIGALIGLALATTLGGVIAPILPKLGAISFTWLLVLPAVIGFAIVWLISVGVGFAAHRPVELHFKYKEDDPTRQAFEKMNKAIGVFVGMLTGVCVFLAVGKPIYSQGYLTTQTSGDAEPSPIGHVNSLRRGMAETGWDKTFSALDRTPAKFNSVADLMGLIYANPALTNRLVEYPPFLALFERPDVTEVFTDTDYLKLLQDQAGFSALINHPRTQGYLNNPEILEVVKSVDLADLKSFLETGKSPKFDEERILGRWRTDMGAINTDARRRRVNMALADLKNLRQVLNLLLGEANMTVYPDHRFVLRVPPPQLPTAPAPAAEDPNAAPRLDASLSARYRLGPRGQVAPPAGTPAAPTPISPADQFKALVTKILGDGKGAGFPDLSTEGTWSKNGDRYIFTFKGPAKEDPREGTLQDNGRLVIPLPEQKLTLVFIKAG
ncbi:MAG: CvpA family protein [Verrucomicrobiales bacterium]|nr:CvpA family protein [Verrucomicrobiales bacterium]